MFGNIRRHYFHGNPGRSSRIKPGDRLEGWSPNTPLGRLSNQVVPNRSNVSISEVAKKYTEYFESLSMNGIFSITSIFFPFVLSVSKDAERIFHQRAKVETLGQLSCKKEALEL